MNVPEQLRSFGRLYGLPGLRLRGAVLVLALDLVSGVFEGLGAAMVLPILDYANLEGGLGPLEDRPAYWQALAVLYRTLGLETSLPALLLTAAAALTASVALSYVQLVYGAAVRAEAARRTRIAAFRDYLSARLSYGDALRPGEVLNDLTTELNLSLTCFFEYLRLAGSAIRLAVYVALTLAVSASMTLVVAAIALLTYASTRSLLNRSVPYGKLRTRASRDYATFLASRSRALRLIRMAGTGGVELDALRDHAGRLSRAQTVAAALGARLVAVVDAIGVLTILLFFYLGTEIFALSVGEISLFAAVAFRSVPRLRNMLQARQQALTLSPSLLAIRSRLDGLRAAVEDDGGASPLPPLASAIEMRGVTFRYEGASALALHRVDLRIPAGGLTAIVGPSGAGKSTLLDLLPRLRDRTAGEILFDGVSIDRFSLSSLRSAFACVPQAPQVFAETAAEHIGYGCPPATRARIEAAARTAGAHDFLAALPQGYDTRIGTDGAKLSGGQLQRLDLARALATGARILLLDEPTSNLDAESERAFRDALDRLRRDLDITVVLVAHRLSLASIADRIAVMEAGRITDTGSHDALLSRDGWYLRAWGRQGNADAWVVAGSAR